MSYVLHRSDLGDGITITDAATGCERFVGKTLMGAAIDTLLGVELCDCCDEPLSEGPCGCERLCEVHGDPMLKARQDAEDDARERARERKAA